MSDVIRVLIVDDDPLVRSALRLVLGADRGIELTGEAVDGAQALEAVRTQRPDVVLMDIRMPVLDGLAATERIVAERSDVAARPRPEVIVLTTFDADDMVLAAMRAGASGFLLKDTAPERILDAVHRVAGGEPILSPSVARQVMTAAAAAGADPRTKAARARLDSLTERERQIALAIGEGKTNAEIAAELYLSVATVKAHVTHVLTGLARPTGCRWRSSSMRRDCSERSRGAGSAGHRVELVVRLQREQMRQPVGRREQRGDRADVPDLVIGQAGRAGGLEMGVGEASGFLGQGQRQVEDRPLPGCQVDTERVDRDVIGQVRLLRADPQDRPVRDHAVRAVVGTRGGHHHEFALGLGQSLVGVHQRVVIVEERPQLGGAASQRPEDVGHEAGLLDDRSQPLAQVLGQVVELHRTEPADRPVVRHRHRFPLGRWVH